MTDTVRLDPAVRELPLEPGGQVEINVSSSGLRIRGTAGDRVVVRTQGGEPVEGEVTIEATPGHVRIRDGAAGELRFGPIRLRGRAPVDLDVDVPRGALLTVKTLSSDVDATGIAGESRWSTASGDLRLRVEGGPVAADSLSGDVSIDSDAPIAVTARSMSGDLHVRAPRLDAVRAETASGDVRLEAAFAVQAIHVVSSVSGDIELSTGSPVRLEAQTISGDIRAAVPHRADGSRGRRTLIVGDGRITISARTTSGDIRLRGGPSEPVGAAAGTPAAPTAAVVAETTAPATGSAGTAATADVGSAATGTAGAGATGTAGTAVTTTGVPATPGVGPSGGAESVTDRREAERLDVLRALERGDLDVEAASRRLQALDDAGPRFFRGWC